MINLNRFSKLLPLALLVALAATAAAEPPQAFLKQSCMDCHEGAGAEGGLDLNALTRDLSESATFDKWVRVVDRVQAGEMPPRDADRPSPDRIHRFVSQTSRWLQDFQRDEFARFGRVRARRLNHRQLERTLQDLLGIDIPLANKLPEEQRTHGFSTVAAGQSTSRFQLQNHMAIVDLALDEAFRRATEKSDEWRRQLSARDLARRNPRRRTREPEILDGKAVVWSARTTFYGRLPVTTARDDGWYRLKIRASALNSPRDYGVWCTVRSGMCVSSAPLLTTWGVFEAQEQPAEWTFEAWLPKGHMFEIRPGDSTLKVGKFAGGQVGTGEGTPQKLPGLALHSAELERIHKGASSEQIRQYLFGSVPVRLENGKIHLQSDKPRVDAAKLMRAFAERAFRRPVSAETLEPYIDFVFADLENGVQLPEALRGGYRALLCSPRFTGFYETPGELDDFALANRLSYLLWGTMPDETLRRLAGQGRLSNDEVLREQTERLLNDPRARHFIQDFADEWLDLRLIDFTEPDRRLYPGFDVIVQESMLRETREFLAELLTHDLSVTNLVDADFTFLNSRLARYYGIPDVAGDQFKRVALPADHVRGGLLTHGAILKVTANGTDTSPVLRGVWISERILGVDIPPPPSNVPAIEPDIRGAKTIREILAKHKSVPECASCHVKIDPPGFALENFDPSGRWRDRYLTVSKGKRRPGPPIDPSFVMPDGARFQNLQEFQKLVCRDSQRLAENFVSKLLTFGTGAPIAFSDREEVRQIVEASRASNFGLRTLMLNAIQSQIFRTK